MVNEIKEISEAVSSSAFKKGRRLVAEFNDAIPTLKYLGFSVTKFSLEIGIAPDIGATLIGSVRALNPKKIKEAMRKRRNNKPLRALLNALLITPSLKDELRGLGVKGIEINVKLGFPTVVNVDLLT